MTDIFISVLNMSITSSYVILAVLLLRLVLRGMPKKYSYALWSVVGFRLVCPVSFRSIFSLFSLKPFDMTKAQSVNENALTYIQGTKPLEAAETTVGIPAANAVLRQQVLVSPDFNGFRYLLYGLLSVWCIGIAVLLVYSAVKFIRLKKCLSTSIRTEKGVYQNEQITSPFIVGIFRPKIYVPSGIDNAYRQYVLAHERYHIKRLDNAVKLLAFCLLVLHWFNPLVWLAFCLMTKDMEMRCDEAVLSENEGIKKAYSTALLSFATNKRFPSPSPLFFSENGVKARIKNVLKYKKPKKLLQAAAIVLCLALLTACAANPRQTVTEDDIQKAADTLAGTESGDVYTAGKAIGRGIAVSFSGGDGRYYDSITVKKDSLRIVDTLGNEIFVSETAQEAVPDMEDTDGVITLELQQHMPLVIDADYRDRFRDGNITCITYTGENRLPAEAPSAFSFDSNTCTYKVYLKNGKPVAFCNLRWVYLLTEKEFVKETSAFIKSAQKEYPPVNEGKKITLARAKELIRNGDTTRIEDFLAYEYTNTGSGGYICWLDIADFNGFLTVTDPPLAIRLYDNDLLSLMMSYPSDIEQLSATSDTVINAVVVDTGGKGLAEVMINTVSGEGTTLNTEDFFLLRYSTATIASSNESSLLNKYDEVRFSPLGEGDSYILADNVTITKKNRAEIGEKHRDIIDLVVEQRNYEELVDNYAKATCTYHRTYRSMFGNDYQNVYVVYFEPPDSVALDGDLEVVVDAETKEILEPK